MKIKATTVAVYLACVSVANAYADSTVARETNLTPAPPAVTQPQSATRIDTIPRRDRQARRWLSDRCRTVLEYAQLGEFNDAGLELLRKSCG